MTRPYPRAGGALLLSALFLSACGSGRDIHGGLRAFRITDEVQLFYPRDLRGDRFTAYVERGDGFDSYAGIGYSDGVFIVVDVPRGEYVLRHDGGGAPMFFVSSFDDIDLSSASLGRTDLQLPSMPSMLELRVSDLAPWRGGDRLELVSANQGVVVDPLASTSTAPRPGQAAIDSLRLDFQAHALPLLDASRGDRLMLTQLEMRPSSSGNALALTKVYQAPALSMVDGGTVTASGAFVAVPASRSLALDVAGAGFTGERAHVHPAAFPLGTKVTIQTLFGARRFGLHSAAPTLARVDGPGDGVQASIDLGDPYPEAWDDVASVEVAEGVVVRAPGATRSATVAAFFTSVVPLSDLIALGEGGLPFTLRIGPPLDPQLEGADAQAPQTGVGSTPRLAWSAPGVGTATGYSVAIWQVLESAGATQFAPVARIFTAGTSARVPPGVLESGSTYFAVITAYDDGARDMGRAPFRLGCPASSAELITATFAP